MGFSILLLFWCFSGLETLRNVFCLCSHWGMLEAAHRGRSLKCTVTLGFNFTCMTGFWEYLMLFWVLKQEKTLNCRRKAREKSSKQRNPVISGSHSSCHKTALKHCRYNCCSKNVHWVFQVREIISILL